MEEGRGEKPMEQGHLCVRITCALRVYLLVWSHLLGLGLHVRMRQGREEEETDPLNDPAKDGCLE